MEQTETAVADKWKDYVDDTYYLYYVDYRDNFNEQVGLLQECVENNSIQPLSDRIWDWWENPGYDELEEVRKKMEADGLEDEFNEHRDDIQEWIWDHDKSTPLDDLLGNTSAMPVFYSLQKCDNYWVEAPFMEPYMAEQPEDTAKKVCKLLNIAEGTESAKKVLEVCQNASYGGELRIYFPANVEDLITDNKYEESENKADWKSIKFKGKFAVAIYNAAEGAGDYELVDLDVEFPFIRNNVRFSEAERYNIEDCFGMYNDWVDECDKPMMSFDNPNSKASIKESVMNQREKHFEEVFRNGGCSVDDDCISRHRGVYYRNDFPCGNVCPHCGHIWYD